MQVGFSFEKYDSMFRAWIDLKTGIDINNKEYEIRK